MSDSTHSFYAEEHGNICSEWQPQAEDDSLASQGRITEELEGRRQADAWTERLARLDRIRIAVDAVPSEWPQSKDSSRNLRRSGSSREARPRSSQAQSHAYGSDRDDIRFQRHRESADSGGSVRHRPVVAKPRSAWDDFIENLDPVTSTNASADTYLAASLDGASEDFHQESRKASSQGSFHINGSAAKRGSSSDSRRAHSDKSSSNLFVSRESFTSCRDSRSQVASSPRARSEYEISVTGSALPCSGPSSAYTDLSDSRMDSPAISGESKPRAYRPPRTPTTSAHATRETLQKKHQISQARSKEAGGVLLLSGVGYTCATSAPPADARKLASGNRSSSSSGMGSSRNSQARSVGRSANPSTHGVGTAPSARVNNEHAGPSLSHNGTREDCNAASKTFTNRNVCKANLPPNCNNFRTTEHSGGDDLLSRLNALRAEAHRMPSADLGTPNQHMDQSETNASDGFRGRVDNSTLAWQDDSQCSVGTRNQASDIYAPTNPTVECGLGFKEDAATSLIDSATLFTNCVSAVDSDTQSCSHLDGLNQSRLSTNESCPLLRFLRRAGLEDLYQIVCKYLTDDLETLLNMSETLLKRLPTPRLRLQRLVQALATERGCRNCSWTREWHEIQSTHAVLRRSTSVERLESSTCKKSESELRPSSSKAATCSESVVVKPTTPGFAAIAHSPEALRDSVFDSVQANACDQEDHFITEVKDVELDVAQYVIVESCSSTGARESVSDVLTQSLAVGSEDERHSLISSPEYSQVSQPQHVSGNFILPCSQTPSVLRQPSSSMLLSAEIGQSNLARPRVREARIKELLRALHVQACPHDAARVEDRRQAAFERHLRNRSRSPNTTGSSGLDSALRDISRLVPAHPENFRRSRSLMDLVVEPGSGPRERSVNILPEEKLDRFAAGFPLVPVLEGRQDRCAICLELPQVGEVVTTLPCCHMYHPDCIREWFAYSQLCPLCKVPAFANDQEARESV